MFKFVQIKPYVRCRYERLSIAVEFAIARKWAKMNRPASRDKNRPTVGEMVALMRFIKERIGEHSAEGANKSPMSKTEQIGV